MNNIKKFCIEKGITQKALGDSIGCSRQVVNYYEKKAGYGVNTFARKTLKKIAKCLDVPPSIVLGEDNFVFFPKTQEEKEYFIKLLTEKK